MYSYCGTYAALCIMHAMKGTDLQVPRRWHPERNRNKVDLNGNPLYHPNLWGTEGTKR